jgi:hypothetical protein
VFKDERRSRKQPVVSMQLKGGVEHQGRHHHLPSQPARQLESQLQQNKIKKEKRKVREGKEAHA